MPTEVEFDEVIISGAPVAGPALPMPDEGAPNSSADLFYQVNSLETLALLYADSSHGLDLGFEEYIDTRFEDTFDIIHRSALKAFENRILGSGDAALGVVLNPNADSSSSQQTSAPRTAPGPVITERLASALGVTKTAPLEVANIMVIGTRHTDIFPIPGSYGVTADDRRIISWYPRFYYDPNVFPIVPGSFVRCKFEQNTRRVGIITEMVNDMPPYTLSGEITNPLKSMAAFGAASTIEDYRTFAGPTPNADRLRAVIAQLGASRVYEKGDEIANGGDITAELAEAATSVMSTIAVEFPHIQIRITGGNDKFHQGLICKNGQYMSTKRNGAAAGGRRSGAPGNCYKSRHTNGRGLDFVLASGRGSGDSDLDSVVAVLRRHVSGNAGMFRFIDEYRNPTSAATAPHIHFSWGEGSEGKDEQVLFEQSRSQSPWNDPIAV